MLKFLAILPFICLLSYVTVLSGCATTDNTEKADLHQRIGLSFYEQGNYPSALREFLAAEQLNPKNAAIQNNLGLTYFMRERYDLSEKHIRKALDLMHGYTDARNNLGRILIEEGKYAEAEKELKLVLNDLTYTGQDRAYMNLGLVYFNQNQFEKARDQFAKSVGLQRDSCTANTYLGRSYFEMKQYEKASEVLDNAIGYCQKNFFDEPHYYSALTYYRLGKTDKSTARFEEILKLYPQGQYRDKSRAMLEILKKGP
jgi:type IV pilus assembly protein PilF